MLICWNSTAIGLTSVRFVYIYTSRHDTETLCAVLAICVGVNPHNRPIMRYFCIFFVFILNKVLKSSYW